MKNTQWGVIFKSLSPSIQNFVADNGISQEQFKEQLRVNKEFLDVDRSDVYFDYWITDDYAIHICAPLDDFYKSEYKEYRNNCTAYDTFDTHPYDFEDWKDRYNPSKSDVLEWALENLNKFDEV